MNSNPEFIQKIHSFIGKYNLLPQKSSIIVGLSGGPDSVFLLHVLKDLQEKNELTLIAAHLDHQWRKNSEADILFCKDLCQKLNIPFFHATAGQLPEELQQKGSLEEIGRRMRRYFLQLIRQEQNADFIALGHHLQDQEETFFIRLIRGTTLAGLTAMKPRDDVYIRPLLQTNKKDIVDYLEQHRIPYLIDPSNVSESFLRNRIRLKVLPALQECDERFDANFLRTLTSLQETDDYLKQETDKLFQIIARCHHNQWHVDTKKLQTQIPYMQNRLIMHWLITEHVPFLPTERFLEEIKRFLYKPEGKTHALHEQWSIAKKRGIAVIEKNRPR